MVDGKPRIGDEVYIHGYIDEIRNDVIIIRNEGGYFGTSDREIFYYEEDERGYGTMNEADRKTENSSEKPNNCVPQIVDWGKRKPCTLELFDDDGNYIEPKDEPQTCDTCRFELYCPEMCEGCCEWDSHYEPKDEPQTERSNDAE